MGFSGGIGNSSGAREGRGKHNGVFGGSDAGFNEPKRSGVGILLASMVTWL